MMYLLLRQAKKKIIFASVLGLIWGCGLKYRYKRPLPKGRESFVYLEERQKAFQDIKAGAAITIIRQGIKQKFL